MSDYFSFRLVCNPQVSALIDLEEREIAKAFTEVRIDTDLSAFR